MRCAIVGVVGVAALILMGAGAADRKGTARASAGGTKKAESMPEQYVPVTVEEIEQHGRMFVGKHLRIRDKVLERMVRFPRGMRRRGITPETHYGFRTHPVLGSNMTCFVPKSNKAALQELGTAVKETRILLSGKLFAHVGRESLFLVDRVIRGWDEPIKAQVQLKMTLSWEGCKKPRVYRIPERRKKYRVACPYTGKPMYVTFEW